MNSTIEPSHPTAHALAWTGRLFWVLRGAWFITLPCAGCVATDTEQNCLFLYFWKREDNPDSSKKITYIFKQLHIFPAYFRSTGKIIRSSTFQAYHAKRIKRELFLMLVPR